MKNERRELAGLLAIAVVFAIACVFLGRWQYHRFQSKYDADHVVGHNYRAAPVELAALLPSAGAPLPASHRWRSVRLDGSYDLGHQLLVRNRPFGGTYGYEVLVPFVPAGGGTALLIDRGWIPNGQTGQAPDSVPAPPSGPATVTVHLLPTEAPKSAALPAGQFASIDLREISSRAGVPLLRAYGVLAAESPRPATAPSLLAAPDDGGYWGVNLSYAVQWGLFAIAGLAFPFVFLRRRRRLRAEDEVTSTTSTGTEPDAVPAGAPAAERRRKTRIWDEEDG